MQTRRKFFIAVGAGFMAACDSGPSTTPTPDTPGPTIVVVPPPAPTKTLLATLQAEGRKATAQPLGRGTAIAIDGSTRWNFRINGELVGIGTPVESPTLDVANLLVPTGATLNVIAA